MSYPQQAIDNILNPPADKRCLHTLKNIAEAETLYVLADDEGECRFWADDGGATFLPVWPEQEFAEMVKSEGESVWEFELEEFLQDSVPWLAEEGYGISVFPVAARPDSVVMPAVEFAARINTILAESYGEAFDLPYL